MGRLESVLSVPGLVVSLASIFLFPYPTDFYVTALALVATIVAILWPRKKPKLEALLPTNDPAIQTVYHRAIYHVGVEAKNDVVIRKARVEIEVFQGTQRLTNFLAKWDSKPEPFSAYSTPPTVAPQRLQESTINDLVLHSKETLPALIKYDGTNEAYGFGAWSYTDPLLQMPPPLPIGEYLVRFLVTSENYWGAFAIRLKNAGPRLADVEITKEEKFVAPKGYRRIKWD